MPSPTVCRENAWASATTTWTDARTVPYPLRAFGHGSTHRPRKPPRLMRPPGCRLDPTRAYLWVGIMTLKQNCTTHPNVWASLGATSSTRETHAPPWVPAGRAFMRASCSITGNFQPTTTGQKDTTQPPSAPSFSGPAHAVVALPRLFGIPSRLPAGSVDTGIGASCPSLVVLCRVQTMITTSLASHPSRTSRVDAVKKASMILGATSSLLRGGQSSTVHARLSPGGIALLSHRSELKVSIAVTITVPGGPPVMRSRRLVLTHRTPR